MFLFLIFSNLVCRELFLKSTFNEYYPGDEPAVTTISSRIVVSQLKCWIYNSVFRNFDNGAIVVGSENAYSLYVNYCVFDSNKGNGAIWLQYFADIVLDKVCAYKCNTDNFQGNFINAMGDSSDYITEANAKLLFCSIYKCDETENTIWGSVCIKSGNQTMKDTNSSQNNAISSAGALFSLATSIDVQYCSFTDNMCEYGSDSSIFTIESVLSATIQYCNFVSNSGQYLVHCMVGDTGGEITPVVAHFSNCFFDSNTISINTFRADDNGGEITLSNCYINSGYSTCGSVTIININNYAYTIALTHYSTERCGAMLEMTPEPTTMIPTLKETPFETPENTPINTPFLTPEDTPINTPFSTPINTPFSTPENTPINTPINTPFLTPEDTPINTPFSTPEDTPINTPFSTPENTPINTPFSTPENTPINTPINTPFLTPEDTPINTPFSTPENTPINTPFSTPENTPINTPINTPFLTPEDTPINTPFSTPENTPINTPFSTPENTPINTPFSTPENTPINTPFLTPEDTPINTPFLTPEDTPINTPFSTLEETPYFTLKESPIITPQDSHNPTISFTFESTKKESPQETVVFTQNPSSSQTYFPSKSVEEPTPFPSITFEPSVKRTEEPTPFFTPVRSYNDHCDFLIAHSCEIRNRNEILSYPILLSLLSNILLLL